MKAVPIALAGTVIALAAACGAPKPAHPAAAQSAAPSTAAVAPVSPPSAAALAGRMRVPGVTVYTAATDPNHLLGRQDGYTSKVSWGSMAQDNGDTQDDPGGSIEVFPDAARAKARESYIQGFGSLLADGHDYTCGGALLRLAAAYTPGQANAVDASFQGTCTER